MAINSVQSLSCLKWLSVQLSHVRLFETPWTAARQVSLSITNSQSPPKLMSIKSVMPSNHLILCRPLLLLPSIFPSIRVFSDESVLRIRWPKYCSFSLNISPSNQHPGLLSFRMDWFDLLAVQGTLKSLLQHHSSKASILLCSAYIKTSSYRDFPGSPVVKMPCFHSGSRVPSLVRELTPCIPQGSVKKTLNYMSYIYIIPICQW